MNEDRNRVLCQRGLSFFGKITASVTHEINNVFSIISQYSGLLEDMSLDSGPQITLKTERLQKLSGNISRQIGRGVTIIKRLNRFAHSVDEPVVSFELQNLLDDIIDLGERFANLKKVELVKNFPQDSISMTSNPFYLQQTVFICLDLAISASQERGQLDVSYREQGDQARIVLESGAVSQEDYRSRLGYLTLLLDDLSGEVDLVTEGENSSLVITVPRSIYSKVE